MSDIVEQSKSEAENRRWLLDERQAGLLDAAAAEINRLRAVVRAGDAVVAGITAFERDYETPLVGIVERPLEQYAAVREKVTLPPETPTAGPAPA